DYDRYATNPVVLDSLFEFCEEEQETIRILGTHISQTEFRGILSLGDVLGTTTQFAMGFDVVLKTLKTTNFQPEELTQLQAKFPHWIEIIKGHVKRFVSLPFCNLCDPGQQDKQENIEEFHVNSREYVEFFLQHSLTHGLFGVMDFLQCR